MSELPNPKSSNYFFPRKIYRFLGINNVCIFREILHLYIYFYGGFSKATECKCRWAAQVFIKLQIDMSEKDYFKPLHICALIWYKHILEHFGTVQTSWLTHGGLSLRYIKLDYTSFFVLVNNTSNCDTPFSI